MPTTHKFLSLVQTYKLEIVHTTLPAISLGGPVDVSNITCPSLDFCYYLQTCSAFKNILVDFILLSSLSFVVASTRQEFY